MVWVPVIPDIPCSGIGLLRPQRLPDHLRPAHAYYRRYDPRTGHRSEFKWYHNAAKDINGKMIRDGVDYWIYAVELEAGELEAAQYDESAPNQLRLTGRLI